VVASVRQVVPIAFVGGARPNLVKIGPILRVLTNRCSRFIRRLVHTGQHYDDGLSGAFLRQLDMPAPDVYLGVGSGSHGAQTARTLVTFEEYLLSASPALRGVVVVGDVNSTLACSLAAAKLGIAVAHVEAGLRSFDRTMPEEINRVVVDAIADVLFVSEPSGEVNLKREGIAPSRVRFVGNVMIDSLARELSNARAVNMPSAIGVAEGGFAFVTLHRPSNVDVPARLRAFVELLDWLGNTLPIVFPVHPRTRERLKRLDLLPCLAANPAVHLLDPLGYRESVSFMAAARMVLTDSGGIQEETSYLHIPCLTLRPNTERPVTVTEGTNTVIGDDLRQAASLVSDILAGRYKAGHSIAGWDGHAAERIVDALVETWV